jgi:hypothetical protein
MATYNAFVVGAITGATVRKNTFPGILLAQMPMDKQIRELSTHIIKQQSTIPAETGINSKNSKQAMLLTASPVTRQSGTTVVVSGFKTPRMTPLEISWTRANKK